MNKMEIFKINISDVKSFKDFDGTERTKAGKDAARRDKADSKRNEGQNGDPDIQNGGFDYLHETIYEELKPVLILSRIFGFAPFKVTANKATLSVLFLAENVLLVLVILTFMYVAGESTEAHKTRSPLSLFFFKIIAFCRNVYAILCLVRFMMRAKVCVRVWTLMDELNNIFRTIYVFINIRKNRFYNFVTTTIFLGVFACFFASYWATMTEPLSLGFCVLFFLPLFNNYLLIFYFSMLTINLKKKCFLMTTFFREEIELYEARYQVRDSIDYLENRRKSYSLLRKIRVLKKVHMKMYEIVKKLNVLFGTHFLYMFIMYFCLGSLHSFTIIRQILQNSSESLFFESVFTIVMESVHITYAVYGSNVLNKEVRNTIITVHKFMTLIKDEDVNLENELQFFCMQLHHCNVNFRAADLFSVDFTMLFQFIVAFLGNAVFFLQVDNINNAKN